jgi:NADH-quinone oxidoreductase subunit N
MNVEQLFQSYRIAVLAPELVLSLFAIAVLLAGAFFPNAAQRRLMPMLALLGVIATGAASAALWNKNLVFGPQDSAIYSADNFALFFKWIFLLGLGFAILMSGRFLDARSGDSHAVSGEFYGLMMLSTVGMMFVAGARDLLVIFLGIETLSIALYVLAGFARRRLVSNEAALKYFLLGAFASGFLLYGIALVYFSTGKTSLQAIAQVVGDATAGPTRAGVSPVVLYLGIALLMVGLSFKAALVPFHQWTPDVYEGAPTPVTAFMAVGAKAAALAALLRVFPGAFGALADQWYPLLLVIAALTMTVGNVSAIGQSSLKRMLAYSSVAHAGYLLIGIIAAAMAVKNGDTESANNSVAGVMYYMVAYALMNLGAFAVLVHLEKGRSARHFAAQGDPRVLAAHETTVHGLAVSAATTTFDADATQVSDAAEEGEVHQEDLRGLAWREPATAAAMSVFLLSLAGIPPMVGFFGKLFIFREAVGQGLIGLVLVGVINSVISVYYYLRPLVAMYNRDGEVASGDELAVNASGAATVAKTTTVSFALGLAIALCAAGVLAMVALQIVLQPWVQEAAQAFWAR